MLNPRFFKGYKNIQKWKKGRIYEDVGEGTKEKIITIRNKDH